MSPELRQAQHMAEGGNPDYAAAYASIAIGAALERIAAALEGEPQQ